jgi:curved DNA-binding protein CbpA
MRDGTYYTVLRVSETATQDEIDRAFRSFVEAYEVLSNSTQRSSYDQQLAQHRQQQAPAPTARSRTVPPCPLYPEVLSKHIGCSVQEAKDFLAGRLPITPSLAREFQSAFGFSVEFWMSQPFQADSMNPFAMMTIVLLFIGLGYAMFVLVARAL